MNDGDNQGMVSAPEMMEQQPKPERMVPQSEVDKLAVALKNEHYEKGKRDAMMTQQQTRDVGMGGQEAPQGQPSREEMARMIREEAQKLRETEMNEHMAKQNQAAAQKILSEVSAKMVDAKGRYEDYDKIVGKLKLEKMPDLIRLANEFPNSGDIFYEFASKPQKLGNIRQLLKDEQDDLAYDAMMEISGSIAKNQDAMKRAPRLREPLDEIKPSSTSTDAEPMSLAYFKKQPWARG